MSDLRITAADTEPGTLVWCGPTHHPEFRDAFQFCRPRVAQLAVRCDATELISRPAGLVRAIVFARVHRSPIAASVIESIIARYPDADRVALLSSLCDGESRTGEPWPSVRPIRFSRWRDQLPPILIPCGLKPEARIQVSSLIIVADRYETAEPYLDLAKTVGRIGIWQKRYQPAAARNFEQVLWDESVARPARSAQWQALIRPDAADRRPKRHVWLVTQPTANELEIARDGGIGFVLTKPIVDPSILV